MSGTVIGHQMFTIEQIELIRRLRNSGVTKEQVVQAFDSLDRLDRELGPLYNVPLTQSTVQNGHSNSYFNRLPSSTESSLSRAIVHLENNIAPSNTQHFLKVQDHPLRQISHHKSQNYQDQQPLHQQSDHGQVTLAYTGNQGVQFTHKNSHSGVLHTALLNAQPPGHGDYTERGIKRQHSESVDFDGIESPLSFDDDCSSVSGLNSSKEEESDNITKQEHVRLAADVKLITSQYDIKKEVLSAMSGQKIAVVDQFLQGKFQEIPEKSFQAVMNAYLAYRKNLNAGPHSKSPMVNHFAQKFKLPDVQELLIPPQRRERFTFREKHLEILERCFKENAYPSQEQRDSISTMCNMAVSNNGARQLPDREKVTPHMILNWFANRRKEVKKIAREEGISTSSVVLPSRISTYKVSTPTEFKSYDQQSDCDHTESIDNTLDSIDNIKVFKQEIID